MKIDNDLMERAKRIYLDNIIHDPGKRYVEDNVKHLAQFAQEVRDEERQLADELAYALEESKKCLQSYYDQESLIFDLIEDKLGKYNKARSEGDKK